MTGGRVPDEWVRRAVAEVDWLPNEDLAFDVIDAVMPLVAAECDRAARDALTEAMTALAAVQPLHDAFPTVSGYWDGHAAGVRESARIVADLRDGAR